MKISINWKRLFLIMANVIVAAYMVFAVTAFNIPADVTEHQICTDVVIDIEQDKLDGFLDASEITNILTAAGVYPLSKPMSEIDARRVEETLVEHPLIETAQCYKAQCGHFCISLAQRIPVVRVLSDASGDYYVDSKGRIMPDPGYHRNLIIATGSISRDYASAVLTPMANSIATNNFWSNQIVQLNVLPDETVEIVPRVGDHILYIGEADDVEHKLDRLEAFYRYGLTQTGWNKYSRISVEYSNQIICKRKQ